MKRIRIVYVNGREENYEVDVVDWVAQPPMLVMDKHSTGETINIPLFNVEKIVES